MAITEYVVVAGIQERTVSPATTNRKPIEGKGEKAKAKLEPVALGAKFFRVEAESNKEAVQAVSNAFPGQINDKCFVVKQSSGEEL
jgi:hypothetical protein